MSELDLYVVIYEAYTIHTWDILYHTTEEVLHSSTAIWMSTDGFLMLYGTFNDSLVEEQKYAWYGTSNAATGNAYLYPEIRSLRLVKFLFTERWTALTTFKISKIIIYRLLSIIFAISEQLFYCSSFFIRKYESYF